MPFQEFRTILFGFAFSPNLEVNLMEVTRIAKLLGAELHLLHVGSCTPEKETLLEEHLQKTDCEGLDLHFHWKEGKPVRTIKRACNQLGVDLLVLGALQHENLYQFYVGSIARKLTRKVSCSVLLLIKPSEERVPCQHVVVNGLEAPETPLAIGTAFYAARSFGSRQVTVVEEIREKDLHVTVEDDRSLKRSALMKEKLRRREESRVRNIVDELPPELREGVELRNQSIFGKRGYSIGHYAEVVRADLLVMNAPRKSTLLDRVFPHDIEYILSDLPTDLLIIRNQN